MIEERRAFVLGLFERLEEPCLRMSWTILEFIPYRAYDAAFLDRAAGAYRAGKELTSEVVDEIKRDVRTSLGFGILTGSPSRSNPSRPQNALTEHRASPPARTDSNIFESQSANSFPGEAYQENALSHHARYPFHQQS